MRILYLEFNLTRLECSCSDWESFALVPSFLSSAWNQFNKEYQQAGAELGQAQGKLILI